MEIVSEPEPSVDLEPFNTRRKAFSSYGDIDRLIFQPISRCLERIAVPAGHVFWRQGDPSAGLYIVKSGVLRASYEFVDVVKDFEESTVAGMVPGEMSALSDAQEIRRWLLSIPRRCGSFVMKLSNSCKSKNRPW